MQQKVPAKYDVEVVTTDDLWARFGSPLPDSRQVSQPQSEYRWHRRGTKTTATLLTLALHAALVSTALLGTAGRPPLKPLNEGASASNQTESVTEFVSVMLLLNDRSITPPDQPSDDSAFSTQHEAEPLAKDAVLLTRIDEPKPPEMSGSEGGTDESSPTAEAMGDEAGRAMLFGRYMGQVKARIERAWDYPVATAAGKFKCKVQIKQSVRGEVQEVTLQRCGDDPAWQLSLVHAIQSASPLSAPPSDAVFTNVITLSFEAESMPRVVNAQTTDAHQP